jgi:hypothetical protein
MPTQLHDKKPIEIEIQKLKQNQNSVDEIVNGLQKLTIKVGNSTKRLITKGTLMAVAGSVAVGGLGSTLVITRYKCDINTWANSQYQISVAQECIEPNLSDINQKIQNLQQPNITYIQNEVAANQPSIQGAQGQQGIQGVQGFDGAQGINGSNGSNGIQGQKGDKGDTGDKGIQGAQGPKGDSGVSGANGFNGVNGSNGVQGPAGQQGVQGIPGTSANVGAQGIQGIQGLIGLTGATGAQGATGNNGADGAVGQTGAQGPQGIQGLKGDKGDQGVQGLIGLTGATGAQGLQGLVGAIGAAGIQGIQGIQGLVGAVGDQGIQGIQGLTGAQGPKGDTGDTGLTGDVGAIGATGSTGAVGQTGAQGIQGIQGIQGEIGFTGAVGATGAQGLQGLVGAIGAAGIQGIQGIQGLIGLTGSSGNNGSDGATGAIGQTGAQGIQGTAGTNGLNGKSLLSGIINPQLADGVEGDFYINTSTNEIFGPKTLIGWGIAVSLIGEQGVQGLTGATGVQGLQGIAGIANIQTASNGLTLSSNDLQLGGLLSQNTIIDGGASNFGLSLINSNLNLSDTNSTGTVGVISFGGSPFISEYGINNSFFGTFNPTTPNLTGVNNTGTGAFSLRGLGSGNSNTGVGVYSLQNNQTGNNNVGFGYGAGFNLIAGDNNIAIGSDTGFYNFAGSNQLNIGNWIYGDNGLIGIGTDTPNDRLTINSGIPDNSGLTFSQLTSASPTSSGKALGVDTNGKVVTIVNSPASLQQAYDYTGSGAGNSINLYDSCGNGCTQPVNITYTSNNRAISDLLNFNNGQQSLTISGAENALGYAIGSDSNLFVNANSKLRLSSNDITEIYAPNGVQIFDSYFAGSNSSGLIFPQLNDNTPTTASTNYLGFDNTGKVVKIATPILTGSNGLTANGSVIELGGNLTQNTIIQGSNNSLTLNQSSLFINSGNLDDSGLILSQFSNPTNVTNVTDYLGFDTLGRVVKAKTPVASVSNGLTQVGSAAILGGLLSQTTTIDGGLTNNNLNLTNSNLNLDGSNATGSAGIITFGNNPFISNFGGNNTFLGYSGNRTTEGGFNTATGFGSMQNLASGLYNSAYGTSSLQNNTTGGGNSAFGARALLNNLTGTGNTAFGVDALNSNVSGDINTAFGENALFSLNSGERNLGLGFQAGDNLVSGNKNLAIGFDTKFANSLGSNQLNIANNIFGTGLNGTVGSPAGLIGIGTAAPTDKLTVDSGNINNSGLTFSQLSDSTPASTATNYLGFDNAGKVVKVAIPTTGPQGPIGLTGAQGIQGVQGVGGAIGLTGAQGLQGIQGIAGLANIQTANNGLTLSGSNLQLGGTLSQPTVIDTTATNTLSLTGLQPGSNTDNVLVQDASGILKAVNGSLFGGTLNDAYNFGGNGAGRNIDLTNGPLNLNLIPIGGDDERAIHIGIDLDNPSLDLGTAAGENAAYISTPNKLYINAGFNTEIYTPLLSLYGNLSASNAFFKSGSDSISIIPNQFNPFSLSQSFNGDITSADLTAPRTWTLPNQSGTIAVAGSGNIALSTAGTISFEGTLPINNGGTGNGLIGPAGSVAYSNGSSYNFTNVGTTGQLLTSQGSGSAPIWTNPSSNLQAGSGINISNGVISTLPSTCNNNWSGVGNGYGSSLCIGGNDGGPANPTIIGLKNGAFSYGLFIKSANGNNLGLFNYGTESQKQFNINPQYDSGGNYVGALANDSGLTLSQLSNATPVSTATNYLGFDNAGKVVKVATPSGGSSYTTSNGLTLSGSNLQLGGTLTSPTNITTTTVNTLSLTGLQSGLPTDKVLVQDASGVIKTTTLNSSPISLGTSHNLLATGYNSGNKAGANIGLYVINSNFFGQNAGSNLSYSFDFYNSNSNFFGFEAGQDSPYASESNFFGNQAGKNAYQAGGSNFLGNSAGLGSIFGSSSNFFGWNAGQNATNANNSIFIGRNSGKYDTVNNSANGTSILIGDNTNTGGFSNSIGLGAGSVNTKSNQFKIAPAYNNLSIGGVEYVVPNAQATAAGQVLTNNGGGVLSWANAGSSCTTTDFNLCFGGGALSSSPTGQFNTGLGLESLKSNDIGFENTAIGYRSLLFNGIGSRNTAVGSNSSLSNINGILNSSVGYLSLRNNINGDANSAFGAFTLQSSTGSLNTAFGENSFGSLISGSGNTSIGMGSGLFTNSGSNNVFVGLNSGSTLSSGNGNIGLGANTQFVNINGSNQLNIANNIFGTGLTGNVSAPAGLIGIGANTPTNKLTVQDLTTTSVAKFNGSSSTQCTIVTGTGLSCSSDRRLKQGITGLGNATDIIKGLRPVTYQWNGGSETQYGLIAQEVQAILPDLVTTNSDGYLSLSQQELMPFVIKALQETNTKLDLTQQGSNITATNNTFTQPNIFNQLLTAAQDLIVKGVSYLQDLVVKGSTIFQGRVEFQDIDMSGQATIMANQTTIFIPYINQYSKTPVVTISGLGHGTMGYILTSYTNGFTIKVDQVSSQDLRFNWIAISNGRDNIVNPIVTNQSSSSLTSSIQSSSTISSTSSSSLLSQSSLTIESAANSSQV